MRLFKIILLGLVLIGCSEVDTNMSEKSLQKLAEQYNIVWDDQASRPKYISAEGGLILRPCDATNESHKDLFIALYALPDPKTGYVGAKVKATPEALHTLIRESYRWEDGDLLSGFVGYSPDNIPFMHCRLQPIPSQPHVAEVYVKRLPEFKGKGYSILATNALVRWAQFIRNFDSNDISGVNKPKIKMLISRVSADNIYSIRLLLESGFKPYISSNIEKFPKSSVKLDGKSYPVSLVITPKHSKPRVIFYKYIKP